MDNYHLKFILNIHIVFFALKKKFFISIKHYYKYLLDM